MVCGSRNSKKVGILFCGGGDTWATPSKMKAIIANKLQTQAGDQQHLSIHYVAECRHDFPARGNEGIGLVVKYLSERIIEDYSQGGWEDDVGQGLRSKL
jgi:hypothetical protein